MNLQTYILIPFLAAGIVLLVPRKIKYLQESLTSIAGLAFFILSIWNFSLSDQVLRIPWFSISFMDFAFEFRLFHTSRVFLLFLGLFAFLTIIYSFYYYKNKKLNQLYYPLLLLSLGCSSVIVLADNFFVLLLGWEFITLLLFFLIAMGGGKAAAMASGKTFAILGFSDVTLLMGILAMPVLYGTWGMSQLNLTLSDPFSITIFILLFIAAISKAGSMPFHSWIPDTAQHAPIPVVALLPAAFDKLLGIYLLIRLVFDLFVITKGVLTIMIILGCTTLFFASIMALVQSDLKKFLGFATISQVGYMLIGFGTGTTLGLIAGVFHMINHAIYKTLLFFGVGIIERETGTTDMNKLGGLGSKIPFTFMMMSIGILAASGIPPLNAFISKWMVYQSILESGKPLLLIIAIFGSAITLASYLKMWLSLFHGQPSSEIQLSITDQSPLARLTLLVPAALCVIFGVFASFPLNKFIAPIFDQNIGTAINTINLGTAFFNPTLATLFIMLGLLLGFLLFWIGRIHTRQVDTLFIGGEKFNIKEQRFLADHLYETFKRMKYLSTAINEGGKGIFDIYNLSSNIGLIFVNFLKKLHDGILSTYLAWCIIGLGIICFLLMVI
jgi:formate hydrogenlyase subunit 3/multisubunit Na+/H+ antiporter MnhD subunit